MQCSETGKQEAVRLEHLNTGDVDQVNKILGMFKQLFRGNGRLTLVMSGGTITDFETQTKTPNERKRKLA